jgi:photosystem II stability/assembly factor-like uncharacterized protein
VDGLNANTKDPSNPTTGSLTQSERDSLVTQLTNGTMTRAQVLRSISENPVFQQREFTRAFVLMQFYGYLRRNPNAAPDVDFGGYNFWLGKLNSFGGNYIASEMVKGFINSGEYGDRFGGAAIPNPTPTPTPTPSPTPTPTPTPTPNPTPTPTPIPGLWSSQTSGVATTLLEVHFLDQSQGWIAGTSVTLLKTLNGGGLWSSITNTGITGTNGFNSVRMLDANTVWVGGAHSSIRTLNGGTSWGGALFSPDSFTRQHEFPTSSTRAWATGLLNTGGRTHFRYTFNGDGSQTSEFFTSFGGSDIMRDIQMLDPNNGWSVGGPGRIVRITAADGASPGFAIQTSNTSVSLNGIFMLDLNTGYVVGDSGTILKTTDGGSTWTPQFSGTSLILNDVHFINSSVGWIVGNGGMILTTTNGGATWVPEASGVATDLRSVFMFGSGVGYAVGTSGTILKRAP